jgi:uncharacterized repeat protein (TIGR01451 family)
MNMGIGLGQKIPWAILNTLSLIALLSTTASVSQAICDDANQTYEQQWNLGSKVEDESTMAYDSNEENLVATLNDISTDTAFFDYLNLPSSAVVQRIVTGNDTAKFIKLAAKDFNNDLLSYTIISPPSHGNISEAGASIIYVPDQGYVGNDSIVFGVNDSRGNLQNVSIHIDVISLYHPPSVRIRSPMSGEIFTADPINMEALVPIYATSTGDVDGIQFYDGLTQLDNGNVEPCEQGSANCAVNFIASLGIGSHLLTATATDSQGKCCTSLQCAIIVNPPEPTVKIASPMAGEIFTAPADITITADVIDSHPVKSVEFYANSKSLGKALENTSPCSFVWRGAMPGVYKLVAKATDSFGSAYSESILVVIVPDKPLSKSDLAITISSSPNPAPSDGLLNYVITVTNRGPDSASDVFVEDFLPPETDYVSQTSSQGEYKPDSGLWKIGSLAKYHSAKLVLTTEAQPETLVGHIYNTAYVYGAQYDPDNSNNHATECIKLIASEASKAGYGDYTET